MPKGTPLQPYEDLTGKTFGRLTVLGRREKPPLRWVCSCSCGGTNDRVTTPGLRKGIVRSCGCLNREVAATQKYNLKHGMHKTQQYRAWAGMIRRCSPTSKDAPCYFQRGIRVCAAWKDFKTFLADMGERPTAAHSLERIERWPVRPGELPLGDSKRAATQQKG
jgi:hypothetical protein